MRSKDLGVLALLGVLLSSCNAHWPTPVVRIPPPASATAVAPEEDDEIPTDQLRLRQGTTFWLMTTESISSKTAKPGDRLRLQAVGGVKVGDLVVIAHKAPAFATITEVKKPGVAWHPGSFAMRMDSVKLVNGQEVPLQSSVFTELGENNTPTQDEVRDAIGSTGGLYLVYFPFSFLEHGEQAIQPRGTVMQAAVQGSILLERASIEASQPAAQTRDEASASLTIYYPEFAPKGSVNVWCGAAKVGKLHRGRRLNLKLPPGIYWLRSKEKKDAGISIHAESGGDQYIEILSPKSREGYLVDRDLGEARAAFTLPADTKDVRDLSKIPLAELQIQISN